MLEIEKTKTEDHAQNYVDIIVDTITRQIHRGRQSVTEIKTVGEVPLNHMLEQVIDGIVTKLEDNGSVVIKGGEVFISHVNDGGSSN